MELLAGVADELTETDRRVIATGTPLEVEATAQARADDPAHVREPESADAFERVALLPSSQVGITETMRAQFMGTASSRLPSTVESAAAEPPRLFGAAFGVESNMVLRLAPKTQDDATTLNYTVAGQPEVTISQRRNHMPHQAVSEADADSLPFSGAVPAPADVRFVDGDGRTIAVLVNGSNGSETARSGLQVSSTHGGETVALFAPASGYRTGEGRSVLYAPASSGANDFFDELFGASAEEAGLVGEQCSICTAHFGAHDALKVLPCSARHAFHAECIHGWLRRKPTCPLCRTAFGPSRSEGTLIDRYGETLYPVGEIAPVLSTSQQRARGYDARYQGGVALYRIAPDDSVASEYALKFDGSKVTTPSRQKVATCTPWYGKRPGTKKLTVAPGADAVLVLALLSEWDANRRGALA